MKYAALLLWFVAGTAVADARSEVEAHMMKYFRIIAFYLRDADKAPACGNQER